MLDSFFIVCIIVLIDKQTNSEKEMIHTEAVIHSVLTAKGTQALVDGKTLGNLFKLDESNVGSKALSPAYVKKLHGRTLKGYLQTCYQINGQVNTLLMKMVHNFAMVTGLIEVGIIDSDKFMEVFPKFVAKMYATEKTAKEFENIKSFEELEEFYVVFYNDSFGVINRNKFSELVPDVKSGHWEGGCDKEKLKELRATKQAKKQLFYTKSSKADKKVVVVCKTTGEIFTVFPSTNFNHRKFSDTHRGMTFEEIKTLVENKFHKEKDLEWFKQFEVEVKA